MRRMLRIVPTALLLLLGMPAQAAPGAPVKLELNKKESVENRCRMSFLIANPNDHAVESLQIDLILFGSDNTIQQRMAVEMGPVRRAKTIVRIFEFEGDCREIGSVLVNDITACVPGEPGACLDQMVLSSRETNVRLFK